MDTDYETDSVMSIWRNANMHFTKYRHSQERGNLNDWFRTQGSDYGSNKKQ